MNELAERAAEARNRSSDLPGRLLELYVRDLALIERLRLELEPGLNVLTGETGAGKSLLIDALGLALAKARAADLLYLVTEELEAPLDLAGVQPEIEERGPVGAPAFHRPSHLAAQLAVAAIGVQQLPLPTLVDQS